MSTHSSLSTPLSAGKITPFRIESPQSELDALQRRLDETRLPERETIDSDAQGARLHKIHALIEHWRTCYDWRVVEKHINQYPQFKTEIDGLGIHFLHIRSRHEDALPLLMTHGWPGSIIEFLETIDPLVNPTAQGGDWGSVVTTEMARLKVRGLDAIHVNL